MYFSLTTIAKSVHSLRRTSSDEGQGLQFRAPKMSRAKLAPLDAVTIIWRPVSEHRRCTTTRKSESQQAKSDFRRSANDLRGRRKSNRRGKQGPKARLFGLDARKGDLTNGHRPLWRRRLYSDGGELRHGHSSTQDRPSDLCESTHASSASW